MKVAPRTTTIAAPSEGAARERIERLLADTRDTVRELYTYSTPGSIEV